MCSFSFINSKIDIDRLYEANSIQKLRGPDNTTISYFKNYTFLHNLLSITGNNVNQPLTNNSEDVILLFNGEIYNYDAKFSGDSAYLLNLYDEDPNNFYESLDGEFAFVICDLKRNQLVVSRDIFGTKPLHIGRNENVFGISSYPSFLNKLGIVDVNIISPNKIYYYSFSDFKIINEKIIKRFDLNQYKNSYDDWICSFENSIKKRTNTDKNIFMTLSSGYDSGVIFHELNRQNINFDTFYIPINEDLDILKERLQFFKSYKNFNEIFINNIEFFEKNVENFVYNFFNQTVFTDNASKGMYQICLEARKRNNKILISGQGSDEIFSDYGILGYDRYNYSTLKGIFPENLSEVFPWNNFFGGKQQAYLLKEESVSGACGIESRYPFLDKLVVQEFLNLSVKLKNRRYKSPLDYYFNKYKFPYLLNDKKGFSPYAK